MLLLLLLLLLLPPSALMTMIDCFAFSGACAWPRRRATTSRPNLDGFAADLADAAVHVRGGGSVRLRRRYKCRFNASRARGSPLHRGNHLARRPPMIAETVVTVTKSGLVPGAGIMNRCVYLDLVKYFWWSSAVALWGFRGHPHRTPIHVCYTTVSSGISEC